jgi:tripartite-type tricarboxylate transporter receptor subunit TctC
MSTTRRSVLAASFGGLAAPALAQPQWPNRRVRIIVPFPPGGGTDLLARIIAQHLQVRLGQPFVVENRAGGSGVVGTQEVARAEPDGYTLAVNASGALTIFPLLTQAPYDPIGSFVQIALPSVTPLLLVVPPGSPSRDVADLLRRGRGPSGRLNACNIGVGSPSQLSGALFGLAFGLNVEHIAHRGSAPALTDAMAGQCDLLFDSSSSSMPLVRQGQLRALGVTASRRLERLPDVPTMAEAGAPDLTVSTWSGLFGPAGTPEGIVTLLNREVRALMATLEQQERMASLGNVPLDLSPAEFTEFMRREIAQFREVVRRADIRL